MSEQLYGSIVTDIGNSLIAGFAAGGEKVNIIEFAVGDANGNYYIPTPDMDGLLNEVWRGQLNSVGISSDSPNIINFVGVIPANVGGFTIREMAIFDSQGQIIAVSNKAPTEKPLIESGEYGDLQITMQVLITNADAITWEVNPNTVLATVEYVDNGIADLLALISSLTGKPTNGIAPNYAALPNPVTLDSGTFYIVIQDENNDGKASVYRVEDEENTLVWVFDSNFGIDAGMMEGVQWVLDQQQQTLSGHIQNQSIHVTQVWKDSIPQAIDNAVFVHNTSPESHGDIRADTAILEGRLKNVELAVSGGATARLFSVTFDDLDGVEVTGTWNSQLKRIEF